MIPIGDWVLHEACRQVQAWQTQFPAFSQLPVSVNVTSKQFSQLHLSGSISHALGASSLNASSLKLEITETCLLENTASATATLSKLGALGIQLVIDDFGTGYSSLSYLHRFPVSGLKIDHSFVNRMENGKGTPETLCERIYKAQGARPPGVASSIIQAIVTLAHSLGMEVTAEGVETAQQLLQLKHLGCEQGQGYFFSQPVTSEVAEALLAANQLGEISPSRQGLVLSALSCHAA